MLTIICPITSRNCGPRVEDQPIFKALLPSMDALEMWGSVRLLLGYDLDDAIWRRRAARARVTQPVEWVPLPAVRRTLTMIWNELAYRVGRIEYLLPANDDLAFQTSPLPASEALDAQFGFGLVGFTDAAFPGLATFYVVGKTHFDIFGVLYPLRWPGAHQDSWIADVYRPWQASEIDERFAVHNRIGGVGAPRFAYGDAPGYREAVLDGRFKVNAYLQSRQAPHLPLPILDKEIDECPMLL